jgi:hypothetical protein
MKEIMFYNFVGCIGCLFIINFLRIAAYKFIKYICKMIFGDYISPNYYDDGEDSGFFQIYSIMFWLIQIICSIGIIRLYFFNS